MTAAVWLAAAGLGSRAVAQEIEVRVVVPKEAVRLVQDAVERVIDPRLWAGLSQELTQALHEALTGSHEAAREIAASIRGSLERWREGAGWVDPSAWQDRTFRDERTDKATHTLQIGPSGSLQLRNLVGDITVTAGSGRTATVEVVRRSRGRTAADAALGLDRVRVEVDQRGERATLLTRYPDERRPPYAVSVTYVVTAPPGTSVTIASMAGDVKVTGLSGDVSVDLTSGDVTIGSSQVSAVKTVSGDVTITDAASPGRLSVSTISGDVRLDRIKARRLALSVVTGDITARNVEAGDVELGSHSGDLEFSGGLVRSGRYELRTHSGEIRVSIPKDDFDLVARSFSGRITTDATLNLRATTTSRSTLRGTVGGGGASLELTTFNGNITISRK